MAKVQVVDVEVLDNPSLFQQKFSFQITFDCMDNLRDDLEWKIIYVGSAESEELDQILDSVLVGPIPAGRHKFVFQADPPNPELIPTQDIVGVTVVIITCTYHGNEFVRVGYYVNNEYTDPVLRENPPDTPQFDKLQRNILCSAPRVTRFKINWDDNVPGEEDQTQENLPPVSSTASDPSANSIKISDEIQAINLDGNRDPFNVLSSHADNDSNSMGSGMLYEGLIENSLDKLDSQILRAE